MLLARIVQLLLLLAGVNGAVMLAWARGSRIAAANEETCHTYKSQLHVSVLFL